MSTVRLTIKLPEELVREIERRSGPRKKNQFIREAVEQCLEDIRRKELDALLKEGYRATRDRRHLVDKGVSGCGPGGVGMNIKRCWVFLASLQPTMGRRSRGRGLCSSPQITSIRSPPAPSQSFPPLRTNSTESALSYAVDRRTESSVRILSPHSLFTPVGAPLLGWNESSYDPGA